MTVLLTVLFKLVSEKHAIHAACSVVCDSGPGTKSKAGTFRERPAFFFFPMVAGFC